MDYNTETWERFKHRRFDKEEIIAKLYGDLRDGRILLHAAMKIRRNSK